MMLRWGSRRSLLQMLPPWGRRCVTGSQSQLLRLLPRADSLNRALTVLGSWKWITSLGSLALAQALSDTDVWKGLSEAHQVPSSSLVGFLTSLLKSWSGIYFCSNPFLRACASLSPSFHFLSMSKSKSSSLLNCKELPHPSCHHNTHSQHVF